MTKLIAVVAGLVLGTLGIASVELASPRQPANAAATATLGAAEDRVGDRPAGARRAGEDVRGPCDEAENAGDARCTGARLAPTAVPPVATAGDDRGDDRSRAADRDGDVAPHRNGSGTAEDDGPDGDRGGASGRHGRSGDDD